ncbi:hypothetical protein [Piscinibacter gummiphilus]|uniref:Uncharacterized protein n=1 Tax=Piscinibacter gummiphilus TaxID=946333 RepID=A0ABZ0D285_9BURK|nr:hypothetical protein [Piscinibacter gummiphilus]WOB11282.1 hypothetical protein RXV79_26995 [Piscinibacter gummiphilus]
MTLRLVSSTTSSGDGAPLRLRQRDLARILRAEHARVTGAASPRTALAGLGAFVGFITPIVLARLVSLLTAVPAALPAPALLCAAFAIIAGLLVWRFSKAARTNTEHLDRLLAHYDPLSKEAYRLLQAEVREAGVFPIGRVHEWASVEQSALNRAMGKGLPADREFLQKKI